VEAHDEDAAAVVGSTRRGRRSPGYACPRVSRDRCSEARVSAVIDRERSTSVDHSS